MSDYWTIKFKRYKYCEALSIIENVEEICPGFFPKAIINKLKGFDNVSGKKE